jgi:clan AA aspartic protease (TIGR02281 family)
MRPGSLAAAALAVLGASALAVAPAGAACVLGKIADLPVTMSHFRPLVNAKFNGHDIQLMADSGAFYSMISRADAERLGLSIQPAPNNLHVLGVGGPVDVDLTRVRTFSLIGVDIPNVEFLVGGPALGVVGVLGRNLLAMKDVEYDLGEGEIRLFHPHGCGNVDLDYWAQGKPDTVVPLEWSGEQTPPAIVSVKVNGVRLRALMDTGADSSALSLDAARRLGIDLNAPGMVKQVSMGVGRRIVRGGVAPISTFEIGGEKISNVKIGVVDMDIGEDMLLGADFFLSHRVFVANSQGKVYITYQGGPVFDLAEHPKMAPKDQALADIADPTDAEGYSRRGAAYLDRGDTERALADFDKAVALAPKEPRYLVQRAGARLAAKRPVVAMSDIDAALALDPGDIDARLARAVLRHAGDDDAGALSDLDAAGKAMAPQANQQLRLGELYLELDRFQPAVAHLDLWIQEHPDDARLGLALNGRCWARALGDVELDRALSDCNRAVGLTEHAAPVLDSRGLTRLRRGEYARAIADYDAALKLDPRIAWSLYGRGIAELKTGQAAAGHADIAAGEALQPKLEARARKLGLAPPEAAPTAASAPAAPVSAPASAHPPG